MKTPIDRIQFYTRKAAQFAKTPFHKRKPQSVRYLRLMHYKEKLLK